MGTINILARRRKDGVVEYGWCGSWHAKNVGQVLVEWYRNDAMVDYLFGLGQVANLSAPLSETCGERGPGYRTCPTGNPYWTTDTESEIFSRVPLVDAAYFYDADSHWYYIMPWPLSIKVPLEMAAWDLYSIDSTLEYKQQIEKLVAERILVDWPKTDLEFASLLDNIMSEINMRSRAQWEDGREKMIEAILESKYPLSKIADDWAELLDYFDSWVVIVPDETHKNVKEILLRRASSDRKETIHWKGQPHENSPEPYVNPYIDDYRAEFVVGYLWGSIEIWDRIVNGEGVDEKTVKLVQKAADPHRLVTEEFLQEFLAVGENYTDAAKKLLDRNYNQLIKYNDEFAAICDMARQRGENKFHQLMKEEKAIWLRQWL